MRAVRVALCAGWLGACTTSGGDPTPSTTSDGTATTAATGSTTAASSGGTTAATGLGTDTTAAVTTGATGSSTGAADTGSSTGATGSTDTTGGDSGLGMLSGECGAVGAAELRSAQPFTFENAVDFRGVGFDYDQLTPGGQTVFDAGNLGGSSIHSEVIAFEVLARCEGATLLATEAEIQYVDPMGTKTDLRVEIDGLPVGVSVTRAVGFPPDDPYTEAQASTLLEDKLGDVLASTANVAPRDAWTKQILHVIAYADMHAQSLSAAYAALPPEVTADTILLVTVTHGDDLFIY